MKFNHLNVPSHWENYWTRYPEGHTILEALISWVSQVDTMIDNQNELNTSVEQFRSEIDTFIGKFDERLQDEVTQTLMDWQTSGFLDVVISEALQTEFDTMKQDTEKSLQNISNAVSAKVDKDGSMQITWANIAQDVREQVLGTTQPAVVGVDSVGRPNLTTDSVGPENIMFLGTSSNIHNIRTDFTDTTINASNGVLEPLAGINTSQLIPVPPETDITSIGYNQIAKYDASLNYISNLFHTTEQRNVPLTENTGAGTRYIRVTYAKNYSGIPRINIGGTLAKHEDFKYTFPFLATDGGYINDKTVTNEKLVDITNSSNLFNKKTMTTKSSLSIPGGEVIPHDTYAVTDFIKVKPNEPYIFKNFINVIEYDESGNYVKYAFFQAGDRVGGATLTTQPKTAFVRGIFNEDTLPLSEVQINAGETLLMYDPNEQISKAGLYGVSASPLWKKTILNLGDSIALGAGVKGYHELLRLKYRMTVHNFSKGGATIRKIASEPANHTVDEQIDEAIAAGVKPDYILFNGNTNDWGNITTGEISDGYESVLDIETYTGAFENVLRKLKNNFPDAKIVYISAHKMSSRSLEEKTRFTNIGYEICNKYSTPYVDIFNESTMNTFFPHFIGKYTLTPTDATHPNTKGYEKYYLPLIESKLNTI